MGSNIENLEAILKAATRMLKAGGMVDAANLMETSRHRVKEIEDGIFIGNTRLSEIQFQIDPEEFENLGDTRDDLVKQIGDRLVPMLEDETEDKFRVSLKPRIDLEPCWRNPEETVSKDVRKEIFYSDILSGGKWSGNLTELDFLERLYSLEQTSATNPDFYNAADEINERRVVNPSWPDDWIFEDSRFQLMSADPKYFFLFLCEALHPEVRSDSNEVQTLLEYFNSKLSPHGWNLVEIEKIGGRPLYVVRALRTNNDLSISRSRKIADFFDSGEMCRQIDRIEKNIDSDPALVIGTAKEMVETCCKELLSKCGVSYSESIDLPRLSKELAKALKLVPEGVSDEAKGAENIKRILQNLVAIPHNMAELRGRYGVGHGREGKHKGLEPRHARLAFISAVAFIDFVTDTYRYRIQPRSKQEKS